MGNKLRNVDDYYLVPGETPAGAGASDSQTQYRPDFKGRTEPAEKA